ncbi:hypothetical protein [Oxalicibacterium faecigallinarum]|uniref:Uncharacterized protein n=1 Tax=Oxalicibacterium faecigallinarum TaxID=573741 RepID=A0A8J3F2X1_9BURK|nr:hypothetical protein [Oxalicibacterium faecigallinarum]GGI18166.1 hypothetical protein GCM10008066_12640 [Oxalicibacterium faecigallinarum]
MDWVPIVFVTFKFLVLAIGMFYAIKWHYDQGNKEPEKAKEMRAVIRAGGKVAAIFMVTLLGLGIATYALVNMLGMDMHY